jgi:hypothetical protein
MSSLGKSQTKKRTKSKTTAAGKMTTGTKATRSDLLRPCDARLMRCYPVSTRVNHVANDDEGCSAPVELAQIQNRLFS